MKVRRFFKQLFCRHEFVITHSRKFAVMRGAEQTGEVTIRVLKCPKCDRETIQPIDRIYYANH